MATNDTKTFTIYVDVEEPVIEETPEGSGAWTVTVDGKRWGTRTADDTWPTRAEALDAYEEANPTEREISLPTKREVCSRCEGHGSHLRPSIGEHAYSARAFDRAFPEVEDKEEYFKRGGIYDVTCHDCKGQNVVSVVDEDACNRDPELKKLLKLYKDHERAREECDRESAAERDWEYKASGAWAADNAYDEDY